MLSRSFDPEDELTASAEWIRITDGKRLGLHTEAMVAAAPLLLVGVSIEMERECHQNDSLADGQVATCKRMVVAAEGVVAIVNKMRRLSTSDHSRSATLAVTAA